MSELPEVATAFVEMAHRIVWCTVSSVGPSGRPRSRILHPFWEWDGDRLVGWIGTGPTPIKRGHIDHSPYVSLNYWDPSHDTCTADARAAWHFDEETRTRVWDTYKSLPPPLGYDPAIIPVWAEGPMTPAFAALRLDPYRLRVFPGTLLLGGEGQVLTWEA